jgi:hypothetical protein
MAQEYAQLAQDEWVSFPGGELEGRRPKALCTACRAALQREAAGGSARPASARPDADELPRGRLTRPTRPLCFQCYRADLDRQRGIAAAGQLDTSSEARFQYQLPLEPVDRFRLDSLKAARTDARMASVQGIGAYIDKRRHAQIAARHALQTLADGLRARQVSPAERRTAFGDAIHAAELQLPEAWLPFVVSR